MASTMRLQHSMTRMLESFERASVQWLQQVEIEFRASNRQFDENFRQMFVQTTNDRLNAAYSKFILESQLNGRAPNLSSPAGNSNGRWSRWTRVETSPIKRELQNESIMLDDLDDDDDNFDAATVAADTNSGVSIDNYYGADGTENNTISSTADQAKDSPYVNEVDMNQSHNETKPFLQRIITRLAGRVQSKNGKGQGKIQKMKRRKQTPKKRARMIKCGKCDYENASQFKINRHSAVHSAEKPFSCENCNSSYKHRQDLKKHMNKLHNVVLL